ncbi:MAG: hypothetical protein QOH16_3393 [Gaiellaceae bacterium]|jgi:hypothetical protein|nr:hypothetical protein [Gaiellaceae bacterium]
MTELAPPLAAAPAEQVSVESEPITDAHAVSFSELVYAHFNWWRNRDDPTADRAFASRYDVARRAFERRHGEIVSAYWCSNVESAVALTEQKRFRGSLSPTWGFHRESDWATQSSPGVAAALHRCDQLAVRANTVLTGVRQRICMQLVVASAAHLLSLVDARANTPDEAATAAALKQERAALDEAEAYYKDAANGQAQMVYFGGMASVAIFLSIVAAIWLGISWATPVAALIAGAIGAVVSVIQRINNGKFTLDYDIGSPYAFFLGGLRPLIGGTFAMAISFAFTGGLLHLPVATNESLDSRRLALLVLGFLAGFSERWAQDTLTSLLPAQREAPAPAPPAPVPSDVAPPSPAAPVAPGGLVLPADNVT